MKFEESVGAIVYYSNEFLLLKDSKGYWSFPKGHIEKGETEMEALRREVSEETGLNDCLLIPGFKVEIGYYYRNGKDLVSKKVTYYLMKALSKNVLISNEHTSFEWLKLKEALERVSFENSRSVLRKAAVFLKIS